MRRFSACFMFPSVMFFLKIRSGNQPPPRSAFEPDGGPSRLSSGPVLKHFPHSDRNSAAELRPFIVLGCSSLDRHHVILLLTCSLGLAEIRYQLLQPFNVAGEETVLITGGLIGAFPHQHIKVGAPSPSGHIQLQAWRIRQQSCPAVSCL